MAARERKNGDSEPIERPEDGPEAPEAAAEARTQAISDAASNADQGGEYGESAMQCESTQLMFAVQAGDHDAFEELSRSLRGRAFHIARSLVGSREDAIELCQETFMKVFSARATYNPSQPFLPWFHRILRNTCFSFPTQAPAPQEAFALGDRQRRRGRARLRRSSIPPPVPATGMEAG